MKPEKKKRVSVPMQTSVVTGAASAALTFGGYLLNTIYGVPAEIVSPLVGALMGFVGHWAGKKDPYAP